ncbi:uncharacterized protein LOC6567759 [Drosophila grimshawi]|uniref:GH12960 n=1 Tax=Drosophila grimshawi TaxID=7222 RepID=B4JT67_DROGR|nr:uncharacterized protein LOC6567759 [Drosophila grimshawi]EDV94957.1 GH12960 [Drosophila grimshawi]
MSNENFSRVHSFIANMCASNEGVRKVWAQFENAVKRKEELSVIKIQAQKDRNNLELDLMVLCEADKVKQEAQQQTVEIERLLMVTFDQVLEMSHLLKDDRMMNMLHYGVLRKQIEVQDTLKRIEESQTADLEYKATMENRSVVQEFRKWQRALQKSQEKYAGIQLESEESNRQWRIKIERVTQQRNQKIIALVQLSKQLAEFEALPELRQMSSSSNNNNKPSNVALTLHLQSARDFLENYPIAEQMVEDAEVMLDSNPIADMIGEDAAPLQSIVVVNNQPLEDVSDSNPQKQVHFAPLPSPIRVDDDSSSLEQEQKSETSAKNFTERAIVQYVQILPKLDLSMEFQTDSNRNLNFSDTFELNESVSDEHLGNGKQIEGVKKSINDTEIFIENNFSPMQTDDCANVNINDISSSMDIQNNEFFLQFDESSEKQGNNDRSYDL